jgi:hypothetical protein
MTDGTIPSTPPVGNCTADWESLSTPERYRRLSQIAEGFALILDGALECDDFCDLVLTLRDQADALLNATGEFAYIGPEECWEQNLPLAAIGWRWPGTIGR